jgi:peptide/nickel transport system substrate-binding protein
MRRSPFSNVSFGVVAVLAIVLLVGAAPSPAASDGQQKLAGTVSIRMIADPGALDPQAAASGAGQAISAYLYDTPIALVKGKLLPSVATKWKVTPTVATLTIRKGVKCTDGTTMSAADVAANFNRMKDPATKAPYTAAYFGSTSYAVSSNNARRTVTVRLSKPFGDLVYGLASVPLICRNGLQNPSSLVRSADGSGPFKLQEAVPSDHYTLVRRAGYKWGPAGATTNADGFPSRLLFRVIANDTTATNLFLTGGLDIVNVLGAERTRLDAQKSTFKREVSGEVFSIFFNHHSGRVTDSVAVRKGLAQAVNRTQLARAINGSHGRTATSYLLPQAPCQNKKMVNNITKTNRTKAIATLRAAGWARASDGKLMKNGKQLTLIALIPDVISGAADYLQSVWSSLGVNVDVRVRTAAQVVGTLFTNGDWDITMVGVGANLPSNYRVFLSSPAPPGGANFMNMSNAVYKRISDAAAQLVTSKSCAVWSRAEKAVHQSVDLLPITFLQTGWYGRKGVSFLAVSQQGLEPTSIRKK